MHTVLRRVVLGLAGPQHGEVAPLGAVVEVADERRAALLRDQRDLVGDLVGGLCVSVDIGVDISVDKDEPRAALLSDQRDLVGGLH